MARERVGKSQVPKELRGLGDWRVLLKGQPTPPVGTRLAPSPPDGWPLLGHARQFRMRDGEARLRTMMQLRQQCGDIARLQFGGMTVHLLSHPDYIRLVLQERNKTYGKATRGMSKLRLVLGTGLLTNDGESWLSQRRIAQPAFHRKRIAGFASAMVHASEEMVARWQSGQQMDAHDEMMRVTLRIVGETLLGTDVTSESEAIGKAVSHIVEDVNERVNSLIDLSPEVPTRRNREFQRSMDVLDDIVLSMIEQRRASQKSGDDLLGMLMDSQDADTGARMTDAQLRDEVMTIFLAGHETTANALTWTLAMLSRSPLVARRVAEEVDSVLEGGRSAVAADAHRLVYTRQVIEETMRLYPPAWMLARAPEVDDVIDGYHIPKGSLVLLSPWVTHRHPDFWEDPEGFDPDRFAPEAVAARHRFAYFPFGGGPRLCIGNNFALMEAQLVLATIMRDWRLDLVPGCEVVSEPLVTLRPKGGLHMVAHRRSDSAHRQEA